MHQNLNVHQEGGSQEGPTNRRQRQDVYDGVAAGLLCPTVSKIPDRRGREDRDTDREREPGQGGVRVGPPDAEDRGTSREVEEVGRLSLPHKALGFLVQGLFLCLSFFPLTRCFPMIRFW